MKRFPILGTTLTLSLSRLRERERVRVSSQHALPPARRLPSLASLLTLLALLAPRSGCGDDNDGQSESQRRMKESIQKWRLTTCRVAYACGYVPVLKDGSGNALDHSLDECLANAQARYESGFFDAIPESCFEPVLQAYEACVDQVASSDPTAICKDVGKTNDLPGEEPASQEKYPDCKSVYERFPSLVQGRADCAVVGLAIAAPSRRETLGGGRP